MLLYLAMSLSCVINLTISSSVDTLGFSFLLPGKDEEVAQHGGEEQVSGGSLNKLLNLCKSDSMSVKLAQNTYWYLEN